MRLEDRCLLVAGSTVIGLTLLLLQWCTRPTPEFVGYNCADGWGPARADTRAELAHCRTVEQARK